MKKLFMVFLVATVLSPATPIFSQEPPPPKQTVRRGDGAGYSTRDATVLSMMGWGVGLAVGVALICGYLEHETSHAH